MTAKALILAAGAGTRMKSDKPKVVHEVLGKPLVRWVVDAAHDAGIEDVVTVLGHMSEKVAPLVEGDTKIAIQTQQLGTGDAVNAGREAFTQVDGSIAEGSLVVLSGDCPLITPETIQALIAKREETGAAVVVLTMHMDDPFGYGRIVREGEAVVRIVEQKTPRPKKLLSRNATRVSTALTSRRFSMRFRAFRTTTPRASTTLPTCWKFAETTAARCSRFKPPTPKRLWA